MGARRALPGEFSQRAYLNDKLDLAQAEAVADLIDAGSRAAARAAMRSLQGDFSRRVNALLDALVALRMYIEAASYRLPRGRDRLPVVAAEVANGSMMCANA
jgi:tRNA modification GTPase